MKLNFYYNALSLSVLFISICTSLFAQDKDVKKNKYASCINFLFGYELPATNYLNNIPSNAFTKLVQPAPSFGLQVDARMSNAINFVSQLYHSYYPFEQDYTHYTDIKNIKQISLYLGPSLKIGRTKLVVDITAMPGFSYVFNDEFILKQSPGFSDIQNAEQVVFSAKGIVDCRISLYKQLAIKLGAAYTFCRYDIVVDNTAPTFYNDRITPFFGICILEH